MIVVSACLLGQKCRWDGQIYPQNKQLMNLSDVIGVCPEQLGGLATPRDPAQIIDGNGCYMCITYTTREGIAVLSSEEIDKLHA